MTRWFGDTDPLPGVRRWKRCLLYTSFPWRYEAKAQRFLVFLCLDVGVSPRPRMDMQNDWLQLPSPGDKRTFDLVVPCHPTRPKTRKGTCSIWQSSLYIYIYIYCCKCLVQCKSELHDQDSIWIVLNHLGEKPIRSTAIRAVSLLRLQLVFGMLPGCWRCLAPRPPAKPSFAVVGDDCELLDHLCRDACRGHKRAKAKASSRILASVTLCRQQRFVTSIFATYIWSTGRQRAQDKSHANPAWSVRWKR